MMVMERPLVTRAVIEVKKLDSSWLLLVGPSLNFLMMDWTGTSQKAKYNQRLGPVVVRHAVPNAVPI
jgi:hypothetical protein